MGMFDYVDFEMDCPKCGTKMKGFQSKDGPCAMLNLPVWEVDNFYNHCDKCGAFVEFIIKRPKRKVALEMYDMTVREKHDTKNLPKV